MTTVSVRLPARSLTLDDVAELADQDPDHRYELQEGNLLVTPPADDEHAELIIRIGAWLMAGGHTGRVLATPGVRVGNSGRSPDLAVRRAPVQGGRSGSTRPICCWSSKSSRPAQSNWTATSSRSSTRKLESAISGGSSEMDPRRSTCSGSAWTPTVDRPTWRVARRCWTTY